MVNQQRAEKRQVGRTGPKEGASAERTSVRARPRADGLSFWLALAVFALTLGLRLAASLPISSSPMVVHPVLEDAAYQVRTLEILSGVAPADDLPRGSLLYPRIASIAPGLESDGSRALARAQSALEALTGLLLFLWVRRRWGNWAGLAAGILYALDPVGAAFAARFSPVVPATLLFLGAVWLWDLESEGARGSWGATAGLAVVLTLGFFLMPLPFLFLAVLRSWSLFNRAREERPQSRRDLWPRLLLPPVLLLLAVGLILVRHNARPEGGPVLGWGGGVSLARAYDPDTGGTPRGLEPPAWETRAVLEERVWESLEHEGTPYDVYRFYVREGLRKALENPLGTVGVLLTKAAATAGAPPVPDELSPTFLTRREAPLFRYGSFTFALLLALGAAGYVLLRGERSGRLVGLAVLAVALGTLLGPASAAARQPLLPLLAALGGAWITGSVPGSRFRPAALAALGAALTVSLAAGFVSPTSKLQAPSEDLRLSALTFAETLAWRQAVPLLEEAVQANPDNLEARVDLAVAYRMDALTNAAEEQLTAAYESDSTHTRTLFELAKLRADKNEIEEAYRLYGRLIEQRPNSAEYRNEYGHLLYMQGRMAEAEINLSRAVQLKPQWTVAQRNLQLVMSERLQLEESLFPDELRMTEDLEYRRMVPVIVQAMQQENWAKADSMLSWAEENRGELAMTHWLRAGYHARRGDLDASIRELETCNQISPGRPGVADQLTRLYLQTGRFSRIEPLLREAMEAAGADSARVRALRQIGDQAGRAIEAARQGRSN